MFVLAVLFPPLAVLLTGRIGSFVVNCILCLCFWVPGIIHACMVVNDQRQKKRHEELIRVMGRGTPQAG